MKTSNLSIQNREPRDKAVTVRVSKSTFHKLKKICTDTRRSQSEIVEILIDRALPSKELIEKEVVNETKNP